MYYTFRFRIVIIRFLYQRLFRKIFFCIDPESTHDFITRLGCLLGRYFFTRTLAARYFQFKHPSLEQDILGIHFLNPIGLAAGFDKNALLLDILPSVGFGFVEIGSVTGEACEGNKKPRLWRLTRSRSLVVNFGLKNDGCEAVAGRLRGRQFHIPVGVSIAKTNCAKTAETEAGIADYVKAYATCGNLGQYVTVNISCPNAFGGQPFTDPDSLDRLLEAVDKIRFHQPIFLKLSPDLSEQQLGEIIEIADKHRVSGFICSNLTKNRNNSYIKDEDIPEQGGFSGKIVEELSNKLVQTVYRKTDRKYVIIGCGGVFSAEDAYRKIRLGASLIQLITGMIYQGPQVIAEINYGLVELMRRDGFHNIQQVIGCDIR